MLGFSMVFPSSFGVSFVSCGSFKPFGHKLSIDGFRQGELLSLFSHFLGCLQRCKVLKNNQLARKCWANSIEIPWFVG